MMHSAPVLRPVFRPRTDAIQALFGRSHAVVGVIHCLPLPGAPDYEGRPVAEIIAACDRRGTALCRGRGRRADRREPRRHPVRQARPARARNGRVMAVIAAAVRRRYRCRSASTCWRTRASQALAVAKASGARSSASTSGPMPMWPTRDSLKGLAGIGHALPRRACARRTSDPVRDVHVKHGAHAITADRIACRTRARRRVLRRRRGDRHGAADRRQRRAGRTNAIAKGTTLPVADRLRRQPGECRRNVRGRRRRDRRELFSSATACGGTRSIRSGSRVHGGRGSRAAAEGSAVLSDDERQKYVALGNRAGNGEFLPRDLQPGEAKGLGCRRL